MGKQNWGASRCASVQRSSSHATTTENSAAVRNNKSRGKRLVSRSYSPLPATPAPAHTHTHILLRVGWRRWWVDRGGGYHPLPVEREREGTVLSQSRSSTTGRKDGRK
jgi:hypothetical protein